MLICAYLLGWRAAGVWVGRSLGFGATAVLLLRRFVITERQRTSAG